MLITQGKTNWKFLLIVVILAAVVGGGIWIYFGDVVRNIISLSQFPEIKKPIKIAEDEIANWKTFEMKETKMTFIYPSNWIIITDPIDLSGRYHALIKGKNGSIDITWAGSEYGGACPENEEKYLILGEKKTICHWFSNENEEVFDILDTSYNGQPYDFALRLSLENKNNAELSSKILSSLKYFK